MSGSATTTTTASSLMTSSVPRRPGAYSVTTDSQGDPNFFHLPVPPNTTPGNTFEFLAGSRRLTVRCPPNSEPGHTLQIAVLPEPKTHYLPLKVATLTTLAKTARGGAKPMTELVRSRNEEVMEESAGAFVVTVPDGVSSGMQFVARTPRGKKFLVTCPVGATAKQAVRILVHNDDDDAHDGDEQRGDDDGKTSSPPMTWWERATASAGLDLSKGVPATATATTATSVSSGSTATKAERFQFFQIVAPRGVRPNQILPVNVGGKRIPVKLPASVVEGQTIQLKLPAQDVIDSIELAYEDVLPGWNRTIRVSDLKFQWVKSTNTGGASSRNVLDEKDGNRRRSLSERSLRDVAFVRNLVFLEGNDSRLRTGTVDLIPVQDAVTDSELVVGNYKTLVSYTNVAYVQTQSLDVKTEWFQSVCQELAYPWESQRIQVVVRRDHLLADAVRAVMSLSRVDMRKRWKVEFVNEPGLDAGGVTREFFELVTDQIFNPDFGLWLSSVNNQICMRINTACDVSCPDDHLIYFRFLGRIIGRALFDGQLIRGHMVRPLYKHLLGWPVTFDDLESQDEEYYNSLTQFIRMDQQDLSSLCLDFTVTEEILGERRSVNLVRGGSQKEVNADNLTQYLELNLKYRMLERDKAQIQELLLGFFDVIPEPALTVFDPNELELILCGLPVIDMDDWRSNTLLTGTVKNKPDADIVKWFWEVVRDDFDQEMKARLLQFVTGTSGVPSRGFSVLQGNDGNIKLFTINGVLREQYPYPRSHTCFNRIDLPNYTSKTELYEKLKLAIATSAVGFDIE